MGQNREAPQQGPDPEERVTLGQALREMSEPGGFREGLGTLDEFFRGRQEMAPEFVRAISDLIMSEAVQTIGSVLGPGGATRLIPTRRVPIPPSTRGAGGGGELIEFQVRSGDMESAITGTMNTTKVPHGGTAVDITDLRIAPGLDPKQAADILNEGIIHESVRMFPNARYVRIHKGPGMSGQMREGIFTISPEMRARAVSTRRGHRDIQQADPVRRGFTDLADQVETTPVDPETLGRVRSALEGSVRAAPRGTPIRDDFLALREFMRGSQGPEVLETLTGINPNMLAAGMGSGRIGPMASEARKLDAMAVADLLASLGIP